MYHKILIPVDGSYRAVEAAEYGIEMATQVKGQVTLCHVIPASTPFVSKKNGGRITENFKQIQSELHKNGRSLLERMRDVLLREGINLDTVLLQGNEAYEICRQAREGQYDLVIMVGQASGYLAGALTNRVTQNAPCPVLVVR